MLMTSKFYKDDVKEIFKNYLASQGYKLTSFNVDINYSEFSSISCNVTEMQPTQTFIVPVGHLTSEEAQKNIQDLIKRYREVITITEDKGQDYIIPQSLIEPEKRNEN